MRNISFHLTQPQILARTKTVTRRLKWLWLVEAKRPEDPFKEINLQPIVKVQHIGGPIHILSARRELLDELIVNEDYGQEELIKEGFPDYPGGPKAWVNWFAKSHNCLPTAEITRIEFEYI